MCDAEHSCPGKKEAHKTLAWSKTRLNGKMSASRKRNYKRGKIYSPTQEKGDKLLGTV